MSNVIWHNLWINDENENVDALGFEPYCITPSPFEIYNVIHQQKELFKTYKYPINIGTVIWIYSMFILYCIDVLWCIIDGCGLIQLYTYCFNAYFCFTQFYAFLLTLLYIFWCILMFIVYIIDILYVYQCIFVVLCCLGYGFIVLIFFLYGYMHINRIIVHIYI